jgi:hypothetical protein
MTAPSRPRLRKTLLGAAFCLSLASPAAVALSEPECANAFTLVQIDQLKLRDSGRIETYLVLPGSTSSLRHHVAPVLTPSSKAVFLCDRDLLASAAEHPYLRPQTSLTIEETPPRPGGRLAAWREWLGINRKVYMHKEDDGAESIQYRNGFVEIHDNSIRRLDPAAVPAGWDRTDRRIDGRPSDLGYFQGEPVFAATRWRRFDLDRRTIVADVPVSTHCGPTVRGSARAVIMCNGHFAEINLDDGSRRRLVLASARRSWTRQEGRADGSGSGPWVVGRHVVWALHQQPEEGWDVPTGIIALVEESGSVPAREELAADIPSSTIRYAQAWRDRLLLVSRTERTAWLFDPETRVFTKHDIPLSPEATDITSISYTRDYLLLAETLPARDGWPASRLLILDRSLKLVHRLDLRGNTESITTTERPWPARVSSDGLHLVFRQNLPGDPARSPPRRQ